MQEQRGSCDIINKGEGGLLPPGLRIFPWCSPDMPKPDIMVESGAVFRGPVIDTGADGSGFESVCLGYGPAAQDSSVAPTAQGQRSGSIMPLVDNKIHAVHQIPIVALADAVSG